MSSDFKPVLVRDSRLNDITSQVDIAVPQGAERSTFQRFSASSSSTSNMSYNIQPPSQSTAVDRNVMIRATVNSILRITNVPDGVDAFPYGDRLSFQAFPLNSIFVNSTATINDNSVSVNTSDIISPLLNMMDTDELAKWKGSTPYMLDRYQNLDDCSDHSNNPMNAYNFASYDQHDIPRGCHPLDSVFVVHNINGGGSDGSTISTSLLDSWVINISATFCEPLLCSPYLFHSRYNEAALLGVSRMNFVFTIDSQLKKFYSCGYGSDVNITAELDQVTPFSNPEILLNFLTTQRTNLLNPRNVLPYSNIVNQSTAAANTPIMAPGDTREISLNNITLDQVPGKIVIVARKAMSAQRITDANSYCVIQKITIGWSNNQGILSGATMQDLWRTSVANGCKQSWYEFSGEVNIKQPPGGAGPVYDYSNKRLFTTGSVLVLDPSRDFSLPAYVTNGSLGNYQLLVNLTIKNVSNQTFAPEMSVITFNDGIFVTDSGSSSVSTGLLNQALVVDTSTSQGQSALSSNVYSRLRGGAISDQIASALKHLPMVRKMSKEGSARSGGARSGGERSYEKKLDSLLM